MNKEKSFQYEYFQKTKLLYPTYVMNELRIYFHFLNLYLNGLTKNLNFTKILKI